MAAPQSAQNLPSQTPNTSAPIASFGGEDVGDELNDSTGKAITGRLPMMMAYVTPAWRYLFGTFVVRSTTVSKTFGTGELAAASYSQSQVQALIDQVAALSKVVGQ